MPDMTFGSFFVIVSLMTSLSEYRASIRRIMEAEDTEAAFKREGHTAESAKLVSGNKSFIAARSVTKVEGER